MLLSGKIAHASHAIAAKSPAPESWTLIFLDLILYAFVLGIPIILIVWLVRRRKHHPLQLQTIQKQKTLFPKCPGWVRFIPSC